MNRTFVEMMEVQVGAKRRDVDEDSLTTPAISLVYTPVQPCDWSRQARRGSLHGLLALEILPSSADGVGWGACRSIFLILRA